MSPTTIAPTKGASSAKSASIKTNRHQPPQARQAENPQSPPQETTKNGTDPTIWRIAFIPVERIAPSPYQPRLTFDADEMAELVASVRAKGVQQPIIVRTLKADPAALQDGANSATAKRNGATHPNLARYELIAGERRLRACKEASRRSIPAIVRDDLSDSECAELALLENVQRSNLSVIEEARGYKRLMLQFRLKEERIAKKVGKSVGTIRDLLKLLQLPEPVQKLLAEKKLTASHGQELLRLAPFERVCIQVAERAAKDHLTALSLQSTLLPNAAELRRAGLVADLDYRTKFDWKRECGQCPHKAYVTSGYNSYCLRPEEWKKKQLAAIAQQQEAAAQVMEEARQANGQPIEADRLAPGSFRYLSHGAPPAGCTAQCPCRGEIADAHDPTKRLPVCLDVSRYNELLQAERQAYEDARRQKYRVFWDAAKTVLQADVESHSLGRIVALLALPVFQARFGRYVGSEEWGILARAVSAEIGVAMPWADLLGEDEEIVSEPAALYALLQSQAATHTPERLLLLCACLLVAYECSQAVRFGGATPLLDFVLGHDRIAQPELESAEVDLAEVDSAELETPEMEPVAESEPVLEPQPEPADDTEAAGDYG